MSCTGCGKAIAKAAGMAVSGATGLAKVALRVGLAESTEIERRRSICRGCPIAWPAEEPRWCGMPVDVAMKQTLGCGCLLAAKTQLASARCPEGKW